MLALAIALSTLAFAEKPHTVEEISEVCPTLETKDDKALCELAVKEVGKLKSGVSEEVGLFLESVEDQNGQLVLSRKRAKHMRTWSMILKAESEDVVLEDTKKR